MASRITLKHLRFPLLHAGLLVVLWTILRAWLLTRFAHFGSSLPEETHASLWKVFVSGLHADLTVAAVITVPLVLWITLQTQHTRQRWWFRALTCASLFVFWSAALFLAIAEHYFFAEYFSRFNTVAIDYVHYWTEVSGNIRAMYPVPTILSIVGVGGMIVTWGLWRFYKKDADIPVATGVRWAGAAVWLVAAAALAGTIRIDEFKVSSERVVNEIANNGLVSGFTALVTRDLEYGVFYPTMPRERAWEVARQAVALPGEQLLNAPESLVRKLPGDDSKPRINIVLMIEESLGSEFWGCLQHPNKGPEHDKTLTPELDKLAQREGLLFDSLYADGNRTIRGIEGIIASFPPLPGDSIVARPHSHGLETLASVLARDGYSTTFIYPGNGWFDNQRGFALANGYQRFLDRADFDKPAFETMWGASNEDLCHRSLRELRSLHASGQPFLLTTLSVTNHQPFLYPDGRIPEPSHQKSRKNAVRYVDWCFGRFFEAAKKEPFWTDTIFAVIADHGARVYGSQTIPIRSYEIPLLLLGGPIEKSPQRRASMLGCQLDVAPTLLGLIGRPYTTTFFGHDLLRAPADQCRVLLNHNRSIGIYRNGPEPQSGRLVTFSLNKEIEAWKGDIKQGNLEKMQTLDGPATALAEEATALYQTADDLYMHGHYRVDPPVPVKKSLHDFSPQKHATSQHGAKN